MQDLRGKIAVVTGGGGGIGRALGTRFLAEGMKVALADIDEPLLQATVDELSDEYDDVLGVATDVSQLASVEHLRDATLDRFGAVHLVCNNAGIIRRGFTTWEMPVDDWHAIIRVNLLGVYHGVRSFVPLMLAGDEPGHIVNVASIAAVSAVPGLSPYTASKHGVLGLSEALVGELEAAGAPIGVTIVMPGLVRTRIGQPADAPDPEGPLEPGQMDPREAGRIVVDAVRADRRYCFTHPELLDSVRARFTRITDPG
jgi:NAD(P)-dependent dehydrogenase (short-subunit alcohol dehydrogenase family)